MIFWFLPLLNAMSYVRFVEIGIDGFIKYVQLALVLSGLFYLLLKSTSVRLSFSVLFILLLLSFNIF